MVNTINDNIEENKPLNWENIESFDEDAYWKNISELNKEKVEQKKEDKIKEEKFKSKLLEEESSFDNRENLILEITWEEDIDAEDLELLLDKLSEEELKKIKDNKDLILEITWEENFDIFDLEEYWNYLTILTREDLEKFKVVLEITWDKKLSIKKLLGYWKYLTESTIEGLENIKENKNLILEITWDKELSITYLLGYMKELIELTKEELENIKANKNLILEITWDQITWIQLVDLSKGWKKLGEFTREDLEKINNNKDLILKSIWKEEFLVYDLCKCWKSLVELNEEDLQNIKKISDKNKKGYKKHDMSAAIRMNSVIKNSNITTIKDYVKRKQEYLFERSKEDKQLINDSEFKELFWFKITKDWKKFTWKFWKWEIFQRNLWYCYLYTAYEILKKMNFFEVLIRTNLKKSENGNWWYVRLPMWQLDWQWIFVDKNEIDKAFDVPEENGKIRKWVSINSNSMLWFKIMEIAYIKKSLINHNDDSRKEFLATWDISLTWEKLASLEWWCIHKALKTLIWDDSLVNWVARDVDEDIVFDNFEQWLMVELWVKENWTNDEIEVHSYWEASIEALEKDVKMISNDKDVKVIKSGFAKNDDGTFELITNRSKEMLRDVVDNNGELQAVFYKKHSYSLERCYIDKSTWEKRVWVVNPWHTWIKFDISLESAKKIFDWDVSYIDIDKLFR